MSESVLKVDDYKIKFENYQSFMGYWLKTNLFHKVNRNRFFIYTVLIAAMLGFSMLPIMNTAFKDTGSFIGTEPLLALYLAIFAIIILLFSALFAAILVYLLGPILIYGMQTAMFLFGPLRKRVNSIELSEEGIRKVSENKTSELTWPAVYNVVETRKSILVFTDRKCALIVPKSAFASKDASENFVSAAKSYWTAATPEAPPPQA
jgi:hypothetical protein